MWRASRFLWPALTSVETFEFLARLHGSVDVVYREELVERFQLDTHKKIGALSKGNRQKVQLIAALATRAELLLLDEPTCGLDPLKEVAFRECVREAKERGQTIFLSSHILGEVEGLCDRVGILRNGRLVDQGTLAQLRHLAAQTVEATFAGGVPRLAPLQGVTVEQPAPDKLRMEVTPLRHQRQRCRWLAPKKFLPPPPPLAGVLTWVGAASQGVDVRHRKAVTATLGIGVMGALAAFARRDAIGQRAGG